jgi:outer membrane protein assembly factor BamB
MAHRTEQHRKTTRSRAAFRWWLAAPLAIPLTLGALVAGPSSPAVAAGLSMKSFTPASGPVGTAVTIKGTGFVAADQVAFNGIAATVSSVNKKGTVLKTSVPPLAGTGPITVTDPTTGQTVGLPGTTFRVTKGITASPQHVWAGTTVTVVGSGLTPEQSEPLVMAGTVLTNVRTNGEGAFQIGVTVPFDEHSGKTKLWVVDPYLNRVVGIIFVLGDWPQFHHDATHTGVDTYETSLTTSSVPSLGLKWVLPAASTSECPPTVAGGLAYIGSDDGTVYAVDATTGAPKWTFTTGGPVQSAPAVAFGIVFVGSYDGKVYALNATTGAKIWSFNTGGDVVAAPTVDGGVVYVDSFSGSVDALAASTGTPLWSFATGGMMLSSPAVSNGDVYVGSNDGNVYALNAANGAKVWSFTTGSFVQSSPAVVKGVVYIGSDDHDVYALNANSGAKVWSFTTGGNVVSSPAVSGSTVYVGSEDGSLYALKTSTGTKLWSDATGAAVDSSPAVANDVVYVGSNSHTLYAFDGTAGTTLWAYTANAKLASSPAVANGRLYIGSEDSAGMYVFGL